MISILALTIIKDITCEDIPNTIWINYLNIQKESPPITRATANFVCNTPVIWEVEQVVFDGGSMLNLIFWEKHQFAGYMTEVQQVFFSILGVALLFLMAIQKI